MVFLLISLLQFWQWARLNAEGMRQLDVVVIRNLLDKSIHLVLWCRYRSGGLHCALHVGCLNVEIAELRFEFVHHEGNLG